MVGKRKIFPQPSIAVVKLKNRALVGIPHCVTLGSRLASSSSDPWTQTLKRTIFCSGSLLFARKSLVDHSIIFGIITSPIFV